MSALRHLLRHAIDYAGLFPPAGLDMPTAAANYAAYLAGPHAWALGRFVVPAARLAELETAAAEVLRTQPPSPPWRLSVLLGPHLTAEVQSLDELNCRHAESGGAMLGDAVELKAMTAAVIEQALARIPRSLQAYVEIPIERDPAELIAAIGVAGARAKVRTGGVIPEAFPRTADLLRFLRACTTAGVPFKATAGLHHPLRARHRLTYDGNGPAGMMFGFLNVFLAAAFLCRGMGDADAGRLLEEGDASALSFDRESITWRGHRLDEAAIRNARESAIVSFGSCSFTEPLEDLESLGLL